MRKVGFFKSIQFKIVLVYTLLILLAMQLIGVVFADRLKTMQLNSFETALVNQSKLIAVNLSEAIRIAKEDGGQDADIAKQVRTQVSEINDTSIRQIEIVDQNNVILAASGVSHGSLIGKKNNNELITQNLSAGAISKYRKIDGTNNERVDIVITPIRVDGQQFGVLYLEKSFESVYSQLDTINSILATATIFALVVTGVLGFFLARTVTKPLVQMQRQVLAVSQGNFTRKVKMIEEDEIGLLAAAFNNMTVKLREATATTESERRKLKSVLTYMTDGVIATDRKGNVILMNNRAEELLGMYRHDITGNSILDLLKIRDDYKIRDLYRMTDSIVLDFSDSQQTMLLRANFSVVKKENGVANGLIGVIHDVTDQEENERERKEFVANVSHELRTPLTTMKSYLEALQDGALEDNALAKKFLSVTQHETERMIRLVNDLLQLSRLDSKDYKMNVQRTDYTAFCENIIDRFEMGKRQNIRFVRKFPRGRFFVLMDRDKLTQVIDNVISNAIKYSPEGGVITFSVSKKNEKLWTAISDQGVGIPKENLAKIFDRFYRVDRARSRKLGGTGLGLAIAKEIVEAQGGEIWAESDWNRGAAIHFILPIDQGQGGALSNESGNV
ncbi:MAG: cell wall metabolism sensor histidine kinase WalK [Sporolactobacillus sp.]